MRSRRHLSSKTQDYALNLVDNSNLQKTRPK